MKPRPNLLCICAMIVALVMLMASPFFILSCFKAPVRGNVMFIQVA
jgi:hypothetical protein